MSENININQWASMHDMLGLRISNFAAYICLSLPLILLFFSSIILLVKGVDEKDGVCLAVILEKNSIMNFEAC